MGAPSEATTIAVTPNPGIDSIKVSEGGACGERSEAYIEKIIRSVKQSYKKFEEIVKFRILMICSKKEGVICAFHRLA